MADYKDFLYDYFRQLHLNGMGPLRRAKLDELRKAGQLNDEQKKWKPGAELPDMNDQTTGLPDEEIDKLYRDFMLALRGMDDKRDEISKKPKGGAIIGKLDRFFGENMPFDKFEVKDKTPIENLMEFLKGDKNQLALYIKANLFTDEKGWKKFVKDAEKGDYNEDFRDQLDRIFRNVPYLPQIDEKLKPSVDDFIEKFSDVPKIIDQSSQDLDQRKVRMFRQPEIYGQLLNMVAGDEDFRNEFARTPSGQKIVGAATQANETTNYEKISIKMTDKLTVPQRLAKGINKVIDNHIAKLTDRHKRHNYATPAKGVVDAIVAEGISPTDGLEKILEKAEDIKKRIEGDKSMAGFNQFVAVMDNVKRGMPKAFAGCLKNSGQMESVKDAVIQTFIESGKFNETKIILEMLGVMRYGALSSDKWAEWKKKENKINLFEGIKLDGFMKWFAVGTDWALNLGVNALFWSVQAGSNLLNNRKQNKTGKELQSDIDFYKNSYEDPDNIKTFQKSRDKAAGAASDPNVVNDIESEKNRARAAFENSQDALDAASKDREEKEKALKRASDAMLEAKIKWQKSKKELEAKKHERKEYIEAMKQKRKIFTAIDNVAKGIRQKNAKAPELSAAVNKANESNIDYKAAEKLVAENQPEFDRAGDDYKNDQELFKKAKKDYDDARTEFNEAVKTEQDRRSEYESAKKINDDLVEDNTFSLMDDLKERRKSAAAGSGLLNKGKVAELDRKINSFDKKHAFEAAEKNLKNKQNQPGVENEKKKYEQIVELLDFWNFQKTGAVRDIKVFRNHKKVQDQFTGDFQGKFSEYVAQHGYAA
jgi:hypothetical protein